MDSPATITIDLGLVLAPVVLVVIGIIFWRLFSALFRKPENDRDEDL